MHTLASTSSLDRLRRRFTAGRPVTLHETFAAARLTLAMRRVILKRLAGCSFGDIAGRRRSRQAVANIERNARRRLGLSASIADSVHAAERFDRAADRAAQAKAVNATDLHADEPQRRKRKPTPREVIQRELSRIGRAWLTADAADRIMLRAAAERLAERLTSPA
jgi:hypothetical protein